MKIKLSSTIIILLFISIAQANPHIIKQGSIIVTTQDLDGYAYKIPLEHRGDYFNSAQRLEKALFSILNMKHMVKYGLDKGYINQMDVDIKVNDRVIEYFPESVNGFDMQQENKIVLLKNFLKQEEAYKQTQKALSELVDYDDISELAEEKYIVNKAQYKIDEERTLDFIGFVYNENNKMEQARLVQKTLDYIGSDVEKFKEVKQQYMKNQEVNVEIHENIKYKYDIHNQNYSDKVFSIDEIGVLPEVIVYNGRFFLTNVTHIEEEKTKSFDEVKDGIINDIKKAYAERQFNATLISLTKDQVEINQDIIPTLKSRYISQEN